MKTGIYGGTFDPPHLGHRSAALEAKKRLGLDRIVLIPAGEPPHKELSPLSAPSAARLEMTRLMADGMDPWGESVGVSEIELDRVGLSYTVDTLRELQRRYPGDELWLLMGTDMLLSFHTWRDPGAICALAHLCAFTRSPEDDLAAMEAAAERLRKEFGADITVFRLEDGVDISSSRLRADISHQEEQAGEHLWSQVYGYILREGLYEASADLKRLDYPRLRAVSYSMMRAKRIPHVQGTEEEAAKLAQRWGGNVDHARRAAILHDCTKYLTVEEHLALCGKYGISLDPLERKGEKLLHAKTGAAVAYHVFGEPEPVCAAIYYHTTGKANMSLLEKILYIADYMEPHRDFPGVEDLRRLAYEDLDGAIILGCQMSVAEMREKRREIHPNTLAALEFLKGMEA